MKSLKVGLYLTCVSFASTLSAQSDIFAAIQQNDLIKVTSLYVSSANPEALRSEEGHGVLAFAISQNKKDVIDALLDLGVNIHLSTRRGSALHSAAMIGDLVSVKLLLNYGADINSLDIRDQSPLIVATRNNQQQTVNYLLAQGASLDIRDIREKTAADHAMQSQNSISLAGSGASILSE